MSLQSESIGGGAYMGGAVDVGALFAPGEKVAVFARVTDFAPEVHAGKPVTAATVGEDGTVSPRGLEPHGQYWLVGKRRSVAYDAPGPIGAQDPSSQEGLAEQLQARAQAQAKAREAHPHLAGATHSAERVPEPANWAPHPGNFERSREAEPQPHVKQHDVPKGTPQRSATPLGQATPVDPDELQPKPAQEHLKAKTPQRSDTPAGEATPVDPREVQPAVPQEEARGKQRSDTETGQADPVPTARSKAKIEQAKDDSAAKAAGATVPKAGTAKGRKAPERAVKGKKR